MILYTYTGLLLVTWIPATMAYTDYKSLVNEKYISLRSSCISGVDTLVIIKQKRKKTETNPSPSKKKRKEKKKVTSLKVQLPGYGSRGENGSGSVSSAYHDEWIDV